MEARDLLRDRKSPFELTLRIRHPSMDPEEISRELRITPEHSFKVGDPRESSSGNAVTAVHCESYWLATLNPADWPAEQLADFDFPGKGTAHGALVKERLRAVAITSIDMALNLSTSHFLRTHSDFLRRIQAEGGDVALIVEIPMTNAQGFTLTPQVTKVMADYGISLDFEFTHE